MRQKEYFVIPILLFAAVILLNSLMFYSQNISTEYLESTDYRGRVQTISKQSLRIRQQILDSLPEDKADAEAYLWEKKQQLLRKNGDTLGSPFLAEAEDYLAVLLILQTAIRYDTMREDMDDTIDRLKQVSIFDKEGYDEALALTAKDFYGLKALDIPVSLDNALQLWLNDSRSDFFVVLFSICLGVCASGYRRNRLRKHIQAKPVTLLPGLVLLCLGIVLLYAVTYYLMSRFLYAYDWNLLVQSLPSFYSCPTPKRLWVFVAEWIAVKCIMGAWIYALTIAFCHTKGRGRVALGGVTALVLALELFLYKGSAEEGALYFLKEINVWSICQFERFVQTYQNLSLFGVVISRRNTFYVFMFVISLGLTLWVRRLVGAFSSRMMEQLQYDYYEEINQKYNEIRQLWHDFHNHLLTIQELMRRGNIEGANQYMDELEEEIDHTHILTRTGMEALDVLLYQKSELARADEIQMDIQIHAGLKEEEFSSVAICCVVGNLLDNSIEAVRKLPVSKRQIQFELHKKGEMLYLCCENPYTGELRQDGKGLLTSKADQTSHGFGLKGIQRVCERYGGQMSIETGEQRFRVQALLMSRVGE